MLDVVKYWQKMGQKASIKERKDECVKKLRCRKRKRIAAALFCGRCRIYRMHGLPPTHQSELFVC